MQDDYIRRKSVQKFKYATQFNEFEKSLNIQFRCAMHYKPKITNLSVEKRYLRYESKINENKKIYRR